MFKKNFKYRLIVSGWRREGRVKLKKHLRTMTDICTIVFYGYISILLSIIQYIFKYIVVGVPFYVHLYQTVSKHLLSTLTIIIIIIWTLIVWRLNDPIVYCLPGNSTVFTILSGEAIIFFFWINLCPEHHS